MDYLIKAKAKASSTFTDLDIFEDTSVSIDLDFYDVDNLDRIKVPVYVSLSLPLTDSNVAVIGYDPRSSTYTTIPTESFDVQVYGNGELLLEGNMHIESYAFNNLTPTIEVRIVDKVQEIFSSLSGDVLTSMYSDLNTTSDFSQLMGSNGGTIGTTPTKSDVVIPYVDFCNDTEKFGYAQRQFTQFGFQRQKAGIVPAFKVKSFVERLFNEASVSVNSRFLELGSYSSSIPGNDPDSLYMLLPTTLRARNKFSTGRYMYLFEGPYNIYADNYTADADENTSPAKEWANWPDNTDFSWNYSPSLSKLDDGYSLSTRTNLPNDADNLTRAFVGPHMSYVAKPDQNGRTMPTGTHIDNEVQMIQVGDNAFGIVHGIDKQGSDAKFNIVAVIWKDGYPWQSIRMMNTNGTLKELDIADATIETTTNLNSGLAGKSNGQYYPLGSTEQRNCIVRFTNTDIGTFVWEGKDIELEAGSSYSISTQFEMVSGSLRCSYGTDYNLDFNNYAYVDTTAFKSVSGDEMAKAVIREDGSATSPLNVFFEDSDTFNPHFENDSVNLYWSVQELEISAIDIMKEIMARFNLSIVYDQSSSSFLLDRLGDIRDNNNTTDLTESVDDLEGINVDIVTKVAKSIELKGLDGLYYETFGYGTKTLNEGGSDELKFDLGSRFYNKSVCGEEVEFDVPEGYNKLEVGYTENLFTSASELGIVFGYIDTPQFRTNLKRPRFAERNGIRATVYETFTTQVFPRFVGEKFGAMPLYYFDENGDTTSLYDFFVDSDNIKFYSRPKISFTGLLDKEYAFNIKDNYSECTLGMINGSTVVIKSVSGTIYDKGIYGDIEGIIL